MAKPAREARASKRARGKAQAGASEQEVHDTAYAYLMDRFVKLQKRRNVKETTAIALQLLPYERPRLKAVTKQVEQHITFEVVIGGIDETEA